MIRIFLISLIVFLPKYGIIDLSFFLSVSVIIYYWVVLKVKSIEKLYIFQREFLFLIVLILYFTTLSLANIVILDDLYVPYYLLKFIRLAVSFLAIFYLLKEFNQQNTIKLLNFLFTLNLSIIFFELAFPEYKELIYVFTNFGHGDYIDITYRVAGLSLGYDASGMIVAFGGLYYLVKINKDIESKKINIFVYFLHLLASIVTARVSFVILILLTLLFQAIYSFGGIRNFIKFISTLLILSIVLSNISYLLDIDIGSLKHAFDRSLNLERYTGDANSLIHSFNIIESEFHNVFGYGLEVFTKYGARSDVGFFQLYWAAGIIGSVIIILFYMEIFFSALKKIRCNYLALLLVFIIIGIFIGNFKGGYIFARQQTEILFIVLILYKLREDRAISTPYNLKKGSRNF
jgi:hypothetical protein